VAAAPASSTSGELDLGRARRERQRRCARHVAPLGELAHAVLGGVARLERDDEVLHLRLGLEGRPRHELGGVLLGEERIEERHRRHAEPPVSERLREEGQPAEDARPLDAALGGALAVVQESGDVVPDRSEAGLEVRAAEVVLGEVEEKLDLDLALAPGQLREAAGERGGVERCGAGRVHGAPPVMFLSLVPRVFRASGSAPGGLAIAFRRRGRAVSQQRELARP